MFSAPLGPLVFLLLHRFAAARPPSTSSFLALPPPSSLDRSGCWVAEHVESVDSRYVTPIQVRFPRLGGQRR
ncbi:unnamed protein product [Urochloa humidicola]